MGFHRGQGSNSRVNVDSPGVLRGYVVPCAAAEPRAGDPMGGRLCSPTYLIWSMTDRLQGLGFWGHVERGHVARLARALDSQTSRCSRRWLIDLRRVRSVDPSAVEWLSNYVRSRAEQLRQQVSAQALLRPHGHVGIVVAGFCKLIEWVYPVEVFTEPEAALKWLGAPDESGVIAAMDELLDTLSETSEVVHAFRTHVSRNPANAKLDTVSAALGLSRRSLQRKLRAANTSFQLEQNTARMLVAKRLLCETNRTIKQVAFDVGCSSAASFSVLFRRVVGQSPSDWRAPYKRLNQCDA